MGNNGKVERIEKAFKYLQYKGLVQDKKNLAIKMNRNTSSISRVLVVMKNISRINSLLNSVIHLMILLIKIGSSQVRAKCSATNLRPT